MIQAISIGFVTGVLLSLTFGTIFFALIQSSIDNGYRSGLKIALGVLASDAVLILIALFGTSYLPHLPNAELYISLIGGVVLVTLGLVNLIRRSPKLIYPKSRIGNFVFYFTKGFLLNILNPINFFSWVTVTAYVRGGLKLQGLEMYTFFVSSQAGIFVAEAALAIFAYRLKHIISTQVIKGINVVTGIVFLIVGSRLFWNVWQLF
ncbi:MAG: LysE family transporter [Spirosomataceae bacterium]